MPLWILSLLGGAKSFLGAALKALTDWRVLAVLALAALLLTAFLEKSRADGLQTRLSAETALYTAEHAAFLREQSTDRATAAARVSDHAAAVSDATGVANSCEARVAKARTTTAAIDALIQEPTHAPPDPSEPELFDPDELRHAVGR